MMFNTFNLDVLFGKPDKYDRMSASVMRHEKCYDRNGKNLINGQKVADSL